MVIFRAGIAVAVPTDYDSQPEHVALVEILNATSLYAAAVRVLETHAVSWLAADVLRGVPWAQRYLNSTARLCLSSLPSDRRSGARGSRALMCLLAGTSPRIGRHRSEPLAGTDSARACAAIARWQHTVDQLWTLDRATLVSTLTPVVEKALGRPSSQRLRQILRKPRLRRWNLVLALASWDTKLSVRRLRIAHRAVDLSYG